MTAVVADSAASLPREVSSELGIEVVPLYLTFGAETLRDGVDVGDFYARLAGHETPVTTSAPSPGDFEEAYERTGQDEIVCVTVAASVSGVHQAARLAAERVPARVEVVDSGAASMAEGFVAMAAARAAVEGAGLDETVERARKVAEDATLVATIDTFEYLRRSGRVGRLAAFAATALDIKPVFRMGGGAIHPLARPRTRSRAIGRVVDEIVAWAEGRTMRLAAFHANAEGEARDLLDRASAELDVAESFVVEFTPAMGAHTGPGVVGLASVPA